MCYPIIVLTKTEIMSKYVDIDGLKTLLARLKEQLDTKVNTSKLEFYTTIDRLNEVLTAYVKTTEMNTAMASKVDKVSGKGLSSNDYTAAEKNKLATLENYDDSVLVAQVEALEQSLNTLVGDSASEAIDNFNEILRFLTGITDTQTLEGMLANIREDMQSYLSQKVDKESGKQLSTNDYTTDEKNKLAGIAAGAQVNSITGVKGDSEVNYRTGNVNITKTNIGLSNVDNTSDLNKPISSATSDALDKKVDKVTGKGLSANDFTTEEKNKLAGIAAGANNYSLPQASSTILGGVRTGENITNSSGTISISKDNVTKALGFTPPTQDTTYGNATQSNNGLMSSEDKTKLDGIDSGAQKNTVTGIKGNAETTYRTGNINLTPANIGAAEASHAHSASEITSGTLSVDRIADGSITGEKLAEDISIPFSLSAGYILMGVFAKPTTIDEPAVTPYGIAYLIICKRSYLNMESAVSDSVTLTIGSYMFGVTTYGLAKAASMNVGVVLRAANSTEFTLISGGE